MNDADKCRANGWTVGTQLVGDEGFGPTVIEITAIGERDILAKKVSPEPCEEGLWTLKIREWVEVAKAAGGK